MQQFACKHDTTSKTFPKTLAADPKNQRTKHTLFCDIFMRSDFSRAFPFSGGKLTGSAQTDSGLMAAEMKRIWLQHQPQASGYARVICWPCKASGDKTLLQNRLLWCFGLGSGLISGLNA